MGQERGEIWTAETRWQPIPPQFDRLLGIFEARDRGEKRAVWGTFYRLTETPRALMMVRDGTPPHRPWPGACECIMYRAFL